jgi:arginyl-tRNA synthetase
MNIEDYLKTQLKQAVKSIGLQEEKPLTIDLSPGKQKEHGDFAGSAAIPGLSWGLPTLRSLPLVSP